MGPLALRGLEAALGRGDNLRAEAGIELTGHSQRATEPFKDRFTLVVCVVALEVIDVDGDQRVIDESLEEFMHQIEVELTHHGPRPFTLEKKAGPAGEIDHHPRQGLIEWYIGVSVPTDCALVSDRLGKGLAEGDPNILDGVMPIDMEITAGPDLKVDQAVTRNLIEHVVKEWKTRVEGSFARAIKPNGHLNLRLRGVTRYLCLSHVSNDTVAR